MAEVRTTNYFREEDELIMYSRGNQFAVFDVEGPNDLNDGLVTVQLFSGKDLWLVLNISPNGTYKVLQQSTSGESMVTENVEL